MMLLSSFRLSHLQVHVIFQHKIPIVLIMLLALPTSRRIEASHSLVGNGSTLIDGEPETMGDPAVALKHERREWHQADESPEINHIQDLPDYQQQQQQHQQQQQQQHQTEVGASTGFAENVFMRLWPALAAAAAASSQHHQQSDQGTDRVNQQNSALDQQEASQTMSQRRPATQHEQYLMSSPSQAADSSHLPVPAASASSIYRQKNSNIMQPTQSIWPIQQQQQLLQSDTNYVSRIANPHLSPHGIGPITQPARSPPSALISLHSNQLYYPPSESSNNNNLIQNAHQLHHLQNQSPAYGYSPIAQQPQPANYPIGHPTAFHATQSVLHQRPPGLGPLVNLASGYQQQVQPAQQMGTLSQQQTESSQTSSSSSAGLGGSVLAFLAQNKQNLSNLIQLLPVLAQAVATIPRVRQQAGISLSADPRARPSTNQQLPSQPQADANNATSGTITERLGVQSHHSSPSSAVNLPELLLGGLLSNLGSQVVGGNQQQQQQTSALGQYLGLNRVQQSQPSYEISNGDSNQATSSASLSMIKGLLSNLVHRNSGRLLSRLTGSRNQQ